VYTHIHRVHNKTKTDIKKSKTMNNMFGRDTAQGFEILNHAIRTGTANEMTMRRSEVFFSNPGRLALAEQAQQQLSQQQRSQQQLSQQQQARQQLISRQQEVLQVLQQRDRQQLLSQQQELVLQVRQQQVRQQLAAAQPDNAKSCEYSTVSSDNSMEGEPGVSQQEDSNDNNMPPRGFTRDFQFPHRIHDMLDRSFADGFEHIVSWQRGHEG
jgi:hypothetical protein